jgi:predicted component of type VI protein secretion system
MNKVKIEREITDTILAYQGRINTILYQLKTSTPFKNNAF